MDGILKRDDVQSIIDNIKTNDKYFEKISSDGEYYDKEEALYIFYEALLKYYIIFDDILYLKDYIYDLDLLFRKIENLEDIRFGISKLVARFSIKYLKLEDEDREKILRFVYDKYITNGYLIHGFSSCYKDDVINNGFKPEEYFNYYGEFIMLNDIFKKHNKDNFINKDFINKEIYFTDDIIKSCIYSINSPNYFCNLLTNNEIIKNKSKDYYNDNHDKCIKYFTNMIDELEFSNEEKDFALDLVNKEWDLLHKEDKVISVLLVKRDLFELEDVNIDDIINSDLDINEAVDRILTNRYKDIPYNKEISKDDVKVINLDIINRLLIEEEKKEEKKEEETTNNNLNDNYGMVSPLILIGSLFIWLGVILSIIKVLGG